MTRSSLMVAAAFAAATLVPVQLTAQRVGVAVDALRDDIPATQLRWSLGTTLQPLRGVYLSVGVRHLDVDQEPFQGLAHIRETLQTAHAEVAALIGDRAALTGGGALNRDERGVTDGEYLVRGQYAVPFGAGRSSVTTVTLEAARARDLSVATAIAERISYDRLTAGLDVGLGRRVSAVGRLMRDQLSDDNARLQGYVYSLLQLVNQPAISVGYAYSFADTDRDNWSATGSSYDAASGYYEYHYFYYPYFTPQQEQGHAAVAAFNWSAAAGHRIAASANVPVMSWGMAASAPAWGTTPQAPPIYGYYNAAGVLPVQASVGASAVISRLTGTIRYEYFSKPYYSYQRAGLTFDVNF